MKNFQKLNATTVLTAVALTVAASAAHANPVNVVVVQGSGNTSTAGSVFNINQTSSRMVATADSFNIATGETTNINQAHTTDAALIRIGDNNPTSIAGALNAKGQVMLVNKNGIGFTSTAKVNVGSLVATTADVDSDANFMAGHTVFSKSGGQNAAVTNDGTITVAEAGMVALVAPTVTNNGTINAHAGKVALAGTDVFTLDPFGDKLVNFALPTGRTGPKANVATVNQNGNVFADEGNIQLTAKNVQSTVDGVVNTTGVTQARSATSANGKIVLEGAVINMGGTTDASGETGTSHGKDGGTITVTGSKAVHFTGDAEAQGSGGFGNGGTIAMSAPIMTLGGTANAGGGGSHGVGGTASFHAGGTFTVNDAEASTIESAMSHGGNVEIGASKNVVFNSAIDDSGQTSTANLNIADVDHDGTLNANVHEKITLSGHQTMTGDASKVTIHEDSSVQNGVDMAADGANIHAYYGTYDENVTVNKNDLTITGVNEGTAGTDARRPESLITGYVNIGGSNVTFDGFGVDGAMLDGVYTGINVHDANNVTLKNNVVANGTELAFILSHPGLDFSGNPQPASTGINVINSTNVGVVDNAVAGFSTGVRIKASDFANVADNGVIAGQYGVDVHNSYLTHVDGNLLFGALTGNGEAGVNMVDAQHAFVNDNLVLAFDTGVAGVNSNYANIRDNGIVLVNNGITLKGSDRAFIKNNEIIGNGENAGTVGISLANSDKARVFTNHVADVETGINLSHSTNADLDRNIVSDVKNGVAANFADNMVATKNKLSGGTTGFGFWIRNSDNVGFETTGNTETDFLHDQQLVNTTVAF